MAVEARAGTPDPLLQLIRPLLTASTTVLDVGAGAGRHTLAIAPEVRHVTAVEPSPAMREQLEGGVLEASLANVTVVAGSWPAAHVEPADVVICSHVAYFVEDVATFLLRLGDVTRGRCFVVHRSQQRELPTLDLFRLVWREDRCLEPTLADLFGAASQLAIWGNVAVVPFATPMSYESVDEAISVVQGDLLNPAEPAVHDLIRAYLEENLVRRDGRLAFATPQTYAGILWWEGRR
jgi:SAM-dependent methyltransferase